MRKGYVYYKDPRDRTFVTPRQGQYYLAIDQSGLIEVRGDQGQAVTQTQFIGTGSTTPGQYLPLAGGTVTGPVLFKGNVDFTNPVTFQSTVNFTNILSSGGTDLSVIISDAVAGSGGGIQGGPFLPVSGGTGGPYTFSGNTNFTGIIQSGGTDLSAFFASYLPLAGGTVTGNLNVTAQIQSGGTDLSTLIGGGGGGAVSTYTNGVNNRIITSTAADGINGESNLTFDGNNLIVGLGTGGNDGLITIKGGDLDSNNTFGTENGEDRVKFHFDTEGDGADFEIWNADSNYVSAYFHNAGGVDLYHQSVVRLQTAASGGTLLGTWNIGQIMSGGTDLSTLIGGGGGAVSTYTNGTNNRVITSTSTTGINGESNLTFDGTLLNTTGNITATGQLKGATILSGATDVSTLFRGLDYTGGITYDISNFDTFDEATENPEYIRTTQTTSVTAGALYRLTSSGAWGTVDASSSATTIGMLGISVSSSSDNPGMLAKGVVTLDSADFGGTAVTGATVYASETAGAFTFDPPENSGTVVRALGYFLESKTVGRNTGYIIYFNPSQDYFVLT